MFPQAIPVVINLHVMWSSFIFKYRVILFHCNHTCLSTANSPSPKVTWTQLKGLLSAFLPFLEITQLLIDLKLISLHLFGLDVSTVSKLYPHQMIFIYFVVVEA